MAVSGLKMILELFIQLREITSSGALVTFIPFTRVGHYLASEADHLKGLKACVLRITFSTCHTLVHG